MTILIFRYILIPFGCTEDASLKTVKSPKVLLTSLRIGRMHLPLLISTAYRCRDFVRGRKDTLYLGKNFKISCVSLRKRTNVKIPV